MAADGTLEEFDTGAADQPTGIAVGSDGNLWFGSNLGSLIGRMDTTGGLSVFTGFGSLQTKVIDIEPGGDGALWFTQGDETRIGRIDVDGTVTDEFDTNFNGGPYGTAFVEYRPRGGTTVTLDLDNAFDTSGNRHRLIFRPNRANPITVIDEFRERNRHLNFGLTLKQTFGGSGGDAGGVASTG